MQFFFSDEDSDFENNPITFNEQWRSDQKIKNKNIEGIWIQSSTILREDRV